MQIAILLFERLTVLDAIGPYQVLGRLPDSEVVFVGERLGPVRSDDGHLGLVVDATLDEVTTPDVVVVPGGPGQADYLADGPVHQWLRTVDQHTTWTTSVCTGALILAAAGLLTGRRATTHWLAVDALPTWGVTPVRERTVIDGKYATAAGVSAGIDMALTLAGHIAGDRSAQLIQLGIEYDPQPPYQAGSPATAPDDVVATLRARSRRFVPAGR
ncbi:MAG TPA: DJ-1/PfpI family protein [Pseudonocardiaceae bacterium]|nr:DJ-1/PfpI family protein [Pseudonocardiaceae bacterium]